YTQYGAAESYTLAIVNLTGTAVPYAVRFESPPGTGAGNYVRDQFDRGDGSPLGGNWTTGPAQIQGGRAVFPGTQAGIALFQGFSASDVGVGAAFALPTKGNATAGVMARASLMGTKLTAYEARV